MADSRLIIRELHGATAELHHEPMPTAGERVEMWIMRPTSVSIAMGSSQQPDQFDEQRLAADHIALASRRSGGGAVFIDPAATVWIDVVGPRTSWLWSPDLAKNFVAVGRLWQQALAEVGVEAELWNQAGERTTASSLACWAGLGWGELHLAGTKVVGLSQRRTRWGVRVQCMAVLDDSAARVADYFADRSDRSAVAEALAGSERNTASGPLSAGVDRRDLEARVIETFERHAAEASHV